jgi:hypothetical protein
MFHGIVLHTLRNCIFVDFFGLIEGMNDCQITYKTHYYGVFHLVLVGMYTLPPHHIHSELLQSLFYFTEGMECHSTLQLISADALLHFSAISITNN